MLLSESRLEELLKKDLCDVALRVSLLTVTSEYQGNGPGLTTRVFPMVSVPGLS
jgi:hypothetical protein